MVTEIKSKLSTKLKWVGNILIFLGLFLIVVTFWPVVKEETKYEINKITNTHFAVEPPAGSQDKVLIPPNKDFSILIPKIGAVAPVFANIDSQDPKAFLPILLKGVAQAKGTALPGQAGNVYIFAHSTDAFYNVGRYNAVFYLLGKLAKGDEIDIYYKNTRYIYKVLEVKVVDAKDTQYLSSLGTGKTLTLQTCYPPGTTLKRLMVIAKQEN